MKQVKISEFAASINGGVDVTKMQLTSMGYEHRRLRRVFNDKGRLAYKTERGNTAYLLPGDVLYLKNGEEVELL